MNKQISKKEQNRVVYVGVKPTREKRRHNGGVKSEIIDRDYHDKIFVKRYKAVWECPLDAYLDRKIISEEEHRAGIKFRRAYYSAVICRRKTYNSRGPSAPPLRPSPSDLVLREAYRKLSPYNKGIIIDICGFDHVTKDTALLNTLKKGLGQLAEAWKATADEILLRH